MPRKTIFDNPRSQAEMRSKNPDEFNPDFNGYMMREPVAIFYLFTTAKRPLQVRDHWLFPRLNIPACGPDERYKLATTVEHPSLQVSPDLERGGRRIDEHNGWRVAIDVLNPANTTMDPWTDTRMDTLSRGRNLILQGCFPSRTNPPSEEDLLKAEEQRDKRMNWLTTEAFRLEAISTKDLNDFIRENPEVHSAMDALGLEAQWHKRRHVTATCPNCGDSIRQGIPFHKSSATNMLCIIDPERAFKAGAITKAQLTELTAA